MRVVYLHQYFVTPAMVGGTRSYEMACRMIQAGHEVHIVSSRTDGKLAGGWTTENVSGICVHWLPVPYDNSMSIPRRLEAFARFAMSAGPKAASLRPDVIFATSTPLTICLPAIWAKWRVGTPMVFEVRDLWPDVPIAMGVLNNAILRTAARWLERWAYNSSNSVVALSPGMAEGVERAGYPRERVHVIPNCSDTNIFDVSPKLGLGFREKRPWLMDRRLLVYAGTFGRVNGVGYMVDLAREMASIDPEFRFLAIGRGAEEEKIRQRASDAGVLDRSFFLEPPVSKAELPTVLSAATLASSFVVPIRELWNNSANKFFDTLAARKPMVINHGGWQSDILSETGAGIELSATDLREAALRLYEFVSDETRMERARKAASMLAYDQFSRDKLAQKLIHVIEEAGCYSLKPSF